MLLEACCMLTPEVAQLSTSHIAAPCELQKILRVDIRILDSSKFKRNEQGD